MKKRSTTLFTRCLQISLPLLLLSSTTFLPIYKVDAAIIINEVSDKGTSSVCDGEDWVELYNTNGVGGASISLSGYILHDDKGLSDDGAYSLDQSYSELEGGSYLLLCCNTDDGINGPTFKIGGDDKVTLYDSNGSQVIDTTGPLADVGAFDYTYARSTPDPALGFVQTTTPTPGSENVITEVPTVQELTWEEQNALGQDFFGMDHDGAKVGDWDAVVDLYVTVDTAEWDALMVNPYMETYVPVNEFKVVSSKGTYILPSPGRMRPRGQSTLAYPICMGEAAIPFKLDFTSNNASQTFFGVEEGYLRTHLSDRSKLQEWTMHRMLARFKLPYLRTRHVAFHVNDKLIGFYTFMEAPDQQYVMARNFQHLDSAYEKENTVLYKVKTLSIDCGNEFEYSTPGDDSKCTSPDGLGGTDCCASDEWNEPQTCEDGYIVTPLPINCWYTCVDPNAQNEPSSPYAFERGDHREPIDVKGEDEACWGEFLERYVEERDSVAKAFFDYGYDESEDCADFLLSQGLIDRDLGSSDYDDAMASFIKSHLSVDGSCKNDECSTKKDLKDKIDVENWLKNFAVYAVVLEQDSPMGNLNNYFLAATRDSNVDSPKWKMVPYDHNNEYTSAASLCDYQCRSKELEDWSIVRPTCKALSENQLVGPLLLDPKLHEQYIEYVREFVTVIYSDTAFRSEIKEHGEAIKAIADVSPDAATYGSLCLERNALCTDGLLDWMKRRSDGVLRQLSDLDSGIFPEDAGISATRSCVTTSEDFSVFPEMCTSPDGLDGYDCCASKDWGEPKTCKEGYSVKDLPEFCWYTCVKGDDNNSSSTMGLIIGITVAVAMIIGISYFAYQFYNYCKYKNKTQQPSFEGSSPARPTTKMNDPEQSTPTPAFNPSFTPDGKMVDNPTSNTNANAGGGAILYSKYMSA